MLEESSGRQFLFGMPGTPLDEKEWRSCLDVLAAVDQKQAERLHGQLIDEEVYV
ncbi:MAG: hypothetical protein WA140_06700 [Geobacteraceae bacterium]